MFTLCITQVMALFENNITILRHQEMFKSKYHFSASPYEMVDSKCICHYLKYSCIFAWVDINKHLPLLVLYYF